MRTGTLATTFATLKTRAAGASGPVHAYTSTRSMSAGWIPLTLAPGTVNLMVTVSAAREAETCAGATGTLASGASGGPFLPQAPASGRVTHASMASAHGTTRRRMRAAITGGSTSGSQDVA